MTEKEITNLVKKHSAKPLFGVFTVLVLSVLLLGERSHSPFMPVSIFVLSVGCCMCIHRSNPDIDSGIIRTPFPF